MTHIMMPKNQKQKQEKKKAWMVMFAVYFASISVAVSMMKVPPAMKMIMTDLNMNMTSGGLLMSTFLVSGVVLAIPVASFLEGWGPKKTGLIALGFTILGCLIGSLARESSVILLMARTIEGVGYAGMMVIAPAVISMWFAPQKRGLPMGIWGTWLPVGMFVIYNLARPLAAILTWRGLWWFNALFAAIAFFVFAAVVDYPPDIEAERLAEQKNKSRPPLLQGLKNINTLILTFIFFLYGFSIHSYVSWIPSFLIYSGINETMANFDASLMPMTGLLAFVLIGFILTKTEKHREVLFISLLITAIPFFFFFFIFYK